MDEKLRKLIEYIGRASKSESVFLTPMPTFNISTYGLLYEICRLWGLNEHEVGLIAEKSHKETTL